ncbi:hypothetical protein [Fictibacillus norfolkensis]|uniref:DUF4305 domain-containing protein n=1 Tax=Fictibacillus norfolkensis TaxID=2762233 RepID=A0ABR8SN61_9BACL|nr:hypothetical protein [Fictibacillus norfolkensis]MBD7964927.1 hypothetical protein [Fictibacillus norfolkensis]
MRDKITSSDLMAYLMFATGFLGTFLTIYHLVTREWEFVWHSTAAALAFIVILFMDKDRKRKENLKIPRD